MPSEADRERFWSKVNKDGPTQPHMTTPCWVWTAGCFANRYGAAFMDGRTVRAHRVAVMLTSGPIPDGLHVCHRCDNPPCCNPDHLFLGTAQDNMADRSRKGRTASGDRNGSRTRPDRRPRGDRNTSRSKPELLRRGENHGRARLTEANVIDVRARHARGERIIDLAREFSVNKSAIFNIVYRRTWKHVPE